MRLTLLIKKIRLSKKRYLGSEELNSFCSGLNLNYISSAKYLTKNRYLITILKGFFYVPSLEERENNNIIPSYFELVKKAMEYKRVNNWYFGLESAIKLNNLTHEYFTIESLINDKIFRPNPIIINGRKIKFIKLKRELFDFGIIKKDINYSDLEKTILDFIYLAKYAGLNDNEIKYKVIEYVDEANKSKLRKYSNYYPKTVKKVVLRLLNDN